VEKTGLTQGSEIEGDISAAWQSGKYIRSIRDSISVQPPNDARWVPELFWALVSVEKLSHEYHPPKVIVRNEQN
jgi:hypothetical protein